MKVSRQPATLLFILSFIIFSCSKDKPADTGHLSASETTFNFPSEPTLDSFVINSSASWKISTQANPWFHFSKDSGIAGNTTVYIQAFENILSSPRTTVFSIKSSDSQLPPVQVTINQSHDVKISGFTNYRAPGGATLNISGRGFSPTPAENLVTINGVNATVQTANHGNLQVIVPGMCGSGPIKVSVANKSDTSDIDFIYEWIGVVTVIAGGTQGDLDGIGTTAQFYHPEGLEFDADNNLYVADYANYKVRKITPAYQVSTLPGRFAPWNNPTGPNSDFGLPTAADADAAGNIFVVEFNSNAVSKISTSGTVNLFAGGNQAALIDGTGTAASFYRAIDLAIDASGNMFIADMDNLCIRKITPAAVVTTFAGGQHGYQDGMGTAARFNRPTGIDIDAAGNLYVTDNYNNRIRKITPAGMVSTIAGTGSHGSFDGDALGGATFTDPFKLAVAQNGKIFVSEANGANQIRIINPNGKVETIASFVDAISGAPFYFQGIFGLAVDTYDVLHASDYYNNRICKLTYK